MRRVEARGRRGRARRRLGGPILLLAGGVYFLLSSAGSAAPPDIVTTVGALSYTENGAATAIDSGLTITDVDGDDTIDTEPQKQSGNKGGLNVFAALFVVVIAAVGAIVFMQRRVGSA